MVHGSRFLDRLTGLLGYRLTGSPAHRLTGLPAYRITVPRENRSTNIKKTGDWLGFTLCAMLHRRRRRPTVLLPAVVDNRKTLTFVYSFEMIGYACTQRWQ